MLAQDCIETILDTMAEAIVITDSLGIITYCNRAMGEIADTDIKDLLGKKYSDFIWCNKSDITDQIIYDNKISTFECYVTRNDHTKIPVLVNGKLLEKCESSSDSIIYTITDITLLRKVDSRFSKIDNEDANSRFNIIGNSREIREIHELIILAAASRATILITGDTGTGKELVSKAVHANSDISGGPFIAVNCSALPENLLESELFGHTRGAFTGAIKDKIGRFEMANGGTLFLDEIGEVSPLIQVKLLRFLQEHEFERVGDSKTRKSDVRIIAATNRNLREMIRDGEFREDLFYRLKVFPIHIPPLCERKQDIGYLVNHFIKKFNKSTGKKLTGITQEAGIILMDYCWPGNIRELENAIEHAFVTCQDGTIGVFDLPVEIRKAELRLNICKTKNTKEIVLTEKDKIIELLNQYNGNKSKVARKLGVDRTTIWRKIKKYGLE